MKINSLNNFVGFLVPLVTVIVVVASIPFVILPQLAKIKAKSNEVAASEERFKKLDAKATALDNIDASSLDQKVKSIEVAVPTGKNVAPLIEGLKKLTNDSNLVLNSIKLKPGLVATSSASTTNTTKQTNSNTNTVLSTAPIPNSKTDLILNVEVTGKYSDYETFLKLIQKTKRLLIVVASTTDEAPDGTVDHSLVLNAPFEPLQNNFNDVASQPLPEETQSLSNLYDQLNSNFIEYSVPIDVGNCPTCGVTNPF